MRILFLGVLALIVSKYLFAGNICPGKDAPPKHHAFDAWDEDSLLGLRPDEPELATPEATIVEGRPLTPEMVLSDEDLQALFDAITAAINARAAELRESE